MLGDRARAWVWVCDVTTHRQGRIKKPLYSCECMKQLILLFLGYCIISTQTTITTLRLTPVEPGSLALGAQVAGRGPQSASVSCTFGKVRL